MSTARQNLGNSSFPVELHSGDQMGREQFHEIYRQMPEHVKAELIGGTVYVSSPLRIPHSRYSLKLSALLDAYETNTAGVQAGDNATIVLSEQDEPQPDLFLLIEPSCGGQSGNTEEGYIGGAPELVAEIAHSSWSIDLNKKRERYEVAGVLEYIVLCIEPKQLRWFSFKNGNELQADDNGIFRSHVFPGLWIQAEALLAMDSITLLDVLNRGLSSDEHLDFAQRLQEQQVP